MVTGLPDAWRRLCLAGGSGMCVVAALVGPVYASGVSASWGLALGPRGPPAAAHRGTCRHGRADPRYQPG
ncbi:hypothetical protein [Actinomyces stomatis]|uniref:hypothetical protein n=1 Tax=Actinomyces stomatis TaxID=3050227 RepID=UPI0028527DCF|nr:hypothetical protein [Actinomyces sp. PK606]